MSKVEFKKYLYIFVSLAFVICLLFTVFWFKERSLLASGEEGIPFNQPLVISRIYNSSWYETGTGWPMPVILPRLFFWRFTSFLTVFFDFLRGWLKL